MGGVFYSVVANRRQPWGGGVLNNLAGHSHMTIDLASLQIRDGARRVFAGTGGVYSIILHAIVIYDHRPRIPTKPGRSTPCFRRTRIGFNHQARSAVMCSASRMEGELHPAKIVRTEAYLFILHLDDSQQ